MSCETCRASTCIPAVFSLYLLWHSCSLMQRLQPVAADSEDPSLCDHSISIHTRGFQTSVVQPNLRLCAQPSKRRATFYVDDLHSVSILDRRKSEMKSFIYSTASHLSHNLGAPCMHACCYIPRNACLIYRFDKIVYIEHDLTNWLTFHSVNRGTFKQRVQKFSKCRPLWHKLTNIFHMLASGTCQ